MEQSFASRWTARDMLSGKHIGIYVARDAPSIFADTLVCGLARAGLKVTVMVSADSPLFQQHRSAGAAQYTLPTEAMSGFSRSATNTGDADAAFAAVRPDIVVFINAHPFSSIAARTLAAHRNMPFVLFESTASPISAIDQTTAWCLRYVSENYKKARAVAALSSSDLDVLRRDYGLQNRKGELLDQQRIAEQAMSIIARACFPPADYISPGFAPILPDAAFPNMAKADARTNQWQYLRSEIPHNWYTDRRSPATGFANRDEAHILYNTALRFRGKPALEIGCWLGWSACHLALGGVSSLDIVDPILNNQGALQSIQDSFRTAGVLDRARLLPAVSPEGVQRLADAGHAPWSLIFIDGDHEGVAPTYDAAVCAEFAQPDALILFHDLAAPPVANALEYLRRRGWKVLVYSTMQIMGAAWRGNVQPVIHYPDPDVHWHIPFHLRSFPLSGM